jgi:general secretion pathway protein E
MSSSANPDDVPDVAAFRTRLREALHHCAAGDSVFDNLVPAGSLAPSAQLKELLLDTAGVYWPDPQVFHALLEHPAMPALKHIGGVVLDGPEGRTFVGLLNPWNDSLVEQAKLLVSQEIAGWVALPSSWCKNQLRTERVTSDSPVVRFVDAALEAAFVQGASDVHFERTRNSLEVRFRLDGVLLVHGQLASAAEAEQAISRIKVLASLDITEQRKPQDGRLRFHGSAGPVDVRVSIMPSVFGEDAVLRLLDKAQLRKGSSEVSLERLGFDEQALASLRELVALPHGMLLVTGPTGSGKTTTVYATLSEVNNGLEKIITIEDPVEYELPGVLQIPVNENKGLTFASGLRSILRHDPDRILVGEIRDSETAEIAVQSALTGHQVFTTVHANSILDVTGRFKHFGLDMHGFMSALNGVIVQRLLRLTCPHCGTRRKLTDKERMWADALGVPMDDVVAVSGCSACRGTGYSGRAVLAEVHCISDELRDLITEHAPVSKVKAHIHNSGVKSLACRGLEMAATGKTTIEEVRRVVGSV